MLVTLSSHFPDDQNSTSAQPDLVHICAQFASTKNYTAMGVVLRRLPFWQQLMAEYEARGEWLRPFSLRDTFSVRAHGIVQDDTLIAAAMGHTVEVHHRSYRTSEWRSVRKAFAGAS